MTGNQKPISDKALPRDSGTKQGAKEEPGWADGLRQLYDTVVNEPLPDNFKDLLSKLDKKD